VYQSDRKTDKEYVMDSRTLLKRCRNNEKQAWAYAYNYIISYLRSKSIQAVNIEDIAQDTLVYYINRGIDETQIRNENAFKKLLRLKANGIAIQHTRSRIRKNEAPLVFPVGPDGTDIVNPDVEPWYPDTMDKLFFQQIILALETTLKLINEDCQKLLIRYFKGLSLGELAKDMARESGLKPNTFSTKIRRCHQALASIPEYQSLLSEFSAGEK
jgi:DNA-directed RNA polymerase specialized sigma24 family protein